MPQKTKLVKLPNGCWVNPDYVTCVELQGSKGTLYTAVWVVKDAGYGTGSYSFAGDIKDEIAKLLNDCAVA
jgi:hypothetical protein